MTVTFYNKTDSQWDSPKIIPRFLPWRVGQLLSLYLVYIQPLAALMGDAIDSGCFQSEYVWAHQPGSADNPEPWPTRMLTDILRTRSGKDLGEMLDTADYRHVGIGIGRKYVDQHFANDCFTDEMHDVEDEELAIEDPLEMSAGRGTATGAARYAVRSDLVRQLSQDNIDTLRPLSQSWHSFLRLESRKGDLRPNQKRHGPEMEATLAKKTKSGWTDRPTTLTITPITHHFGAAVTATSTAVTAVPTMPSRQMQSPPLHVFDVAEGSPWPPIPSSSTVPSIQVPSVMPDSQQRVRAVRKALGLADLTPVVYKSPEQEQALEQIMSFNNPDPALVVVLPTGGGKSLLFTAPACLEQSGMTIVVIPYRQLITETVNDAVARGIEAIEWTPDLKEPKKLVVVSADSLTSEFFNYTTRMTDKKWLRRVFLDECHLAVTAHSWRPRLIHLPRLQSIEAPLIMLTATLPLHMEREFKATMLLSQSPCCLIRASTARKSTRYTVKSTVAKGKLMQEVTTFCKEQMDRLQPEAKMIVFCRTQKQCKELGLALGCDHFYSGSPHNTQVIQSWKGKGGCVVATSSLGTGVSYKDVALTVHVGMPYGLIDFAQQSGRAGRDGEAVPSFILMEKDWFATESECRSSRDQVWSVDELGMIDFVYTEGCRRLVLGKYFDGDSPQDCKSGDMERCDRCCSGVSAWTRSQKLRVVDRHIVQETLNQIAIGCPVCWVTLALGFGPSTGRVHTPWSQACTQRETVNRTGSTGGKLSMSKVECDQFRGKIRYAKDANACYRCGISQKLCHTREAEGECQWPRIAPAILRLATAYDAGREIITKAGYTGGMNDWSAYALWLGQMHSQRLWLELVSNSMVVISGFLLHCQRLMKLEPWDFDPEIDDDVGDLMEEMWSSAPVAPARVAGVLEAHATDRDGEPAESEIDDGLGEIIQRELPSRRGVPRAMLDPSCLTHLKQLIDDWGSQCVVCKLHGKKRRDDHQWNDCDSVQGGKEKMEHAFTFLTDIKFQPYAHCKWCYRPQAICEIWEHGVNNRGWATFKKLPGADCTARQVVKDAAAAFLAFGATDNLEEWSRDGKLVANKGELGTKYKRGGLEFSGLVRYFYKWA
ncbi:hypothetical protein E4U52_000123 [Claviceps spartinae]|nr:hypothetical protein E4U52_000123 [Claviceps spartinae]